eukprot:1402539-Rhodomonas_salina.9
MSVPHSETDISHPCAHSTQSSHRASRSALGGWRVAGRVRIRYAMPGTEMRGAYRATRSLWHVRTAGFSAGHRNAHASTAKSNRQQGSGPNGAEIVFSGGCFWSAGGYPLQIVW